MKKRKVFIVGDSTACVYPHCGEKNRFPRTGWGQVVDRFLPEFQIVDLAISARSSKSFKKEENFKYLKGYIATGDYLIIQFGHNDAKADDPERYTKTDYEYQESLMEYVRIARRVGAIPILATSISRNRASDAWLEEYVNSVRELARIEELPLMDLYSATNDYINRRGSAASAEMFMNVERMDSRFIDDPRYKGSEFYDKYTLDDVHLNINGAILIAEMAADMLHEIIEKTD